MKLDELLIFAGLTCLISAFPQPALKLRAGSNSTSEKSTLTYTATKTLQVNSTVTGNATVLTPVTVTKPFKIPYGSPVYTGTVTSTYSSLTTVTSTSNPSSTTQVATPPGFLPILSESYFTDDIVIETATVTTTSTSTYDPSPTTVQGGSIVFAYEGSTFTGYFTTDSVVVVSTSITVTETAYPSVYTEYAACKPDNLAARIPTGQHINYVGEYGPYGYSAFDTESALDCCRACQSNSLCFGGGWEEKPYHGTCFVQTIEPDYPGNATETCNPANSYGVFGTDPDVEGGVDAWGFVAFNGPCGQLDWQFNGDLYVQ